MSEGARISLVIVSHSRKLAEGVRELAQQMAPSVQIEAAGGREDGGIGTSFDLVSSACERALSASGERGVVVLTDLGSANMVAESVIDFSAHPERIILVDAPLVEAAVVGAVASQQGEDLSGVILAIKQGAAQALEEAPEVGSADPLEGDAVTQTATVGDKAGLHARPAAEFVKMASVFDAQIRIDGADAKSLMEVMALGRRQGEQVVISATGPQATEAVANLSSALTAGFDK
ncbi:dihydroxyacetone kinase phosphoryl donor subunit DhaM [Scrofimicrobium sp. R131]|uniref:Phosphocarrier protein HPr n=1 Tax=Scrofimicrobium appendicitidis TaxID=3079930 RepID=A0AAU7V7U0_9ACTO